MIPTRSRCGSSRFYEPLPEKEKGRGKPKNPDPSSYESHLGDDHPYYRGEQSIFQFLKIHKRPEPPIRNPGPAHITDKELTRASACSLLAPFEPDEQANFDRRIAKTKHLRALSALVPKTCPFPA